MRKQRKPISLNRETIHALTLDSADLRGAAGGFATIHTCGNPCTTACSQSCTDCCSNIRTFCVC